VTKLLATVAALALILVGGEALALPAVQSNHRLEHQSSTGHLGRVHGRGHVGMEVHSFSYGVKAPLDNATGHLTGKRQHKPIVFTGRRVHGVARDAASGLPTGKRMH
jgi:hypothetical protein